MYWNEINISRCFILSRSARHTYMKKMAYSLFLFSYFTFLHFSSSALQIWMQRMMLIIQFAHVAVILLPCFCLIHAAGNSNEKQVSDINPYSSSSLLCQNVKNWNYNFYLILFCFTLDNSLPSCGEIIRPFFFIRVTSLLLLSRQV